MFPMLLNMPTKTIINIIFDINSDGLLNNESGSLRSTVIERCLLVWRKRSAVQKPKDRIKILERALREMNKNEFADAMLERFSNREPITPDMFE